jgi:hypothetical protein
MSSDSLIVNIDYNDNMDLNEGTLSPDNLSYIINITNKPINILNKKIKNTNKYKNKYLIIKILIKILILLSTIIILCILYL